MAEEKNQLSRGLTLTGTTALVIGTVIGTGVFLKAAPMAQGVGAPTLVMVAWVAAGLLTLAGALTYAELGAMLKPIRDFLTLWIPHTQPQTIARLHALAQIVEQDYSGEQARFRARIPPYVRHEFEPFVVAEAV